MEIIIDIDDSVPLVTQLMGQIKRAVLRDKMLAGDPLPSIRQLANDLDLDNKTVAQAYRLLERDSVIQITGHRGTFIHPTSAVTRNAVEERCLDQWRLALKNHSDIVEWLDPSSQRS